MAKRPSRYEKMQKFLNSAEHKADYVYELWFIRKGTNKSDPNDIRYFPRIPLHGDPKENPNELKDGITRFQLEHDTDNWQNIAEDYEVIDYWFG